MHFHLHRFITLRQKKKTIYLNYPQNAFDCMEMHSSEHSGRFLVSKYNKSSLFFGMTDENDCLERKVYIFCYDQIFNIILSRFSNLRLSIWLVVGDHDNSQRL